LRLKAGINKPTNQHPVAFSALTGLHIRKSIPLVKYLVMSVGMIIYHLRLH